MLLAPLGPGQSVWVSDSSISSSGGFSYTSSYYHEEFKADTDWPAGTVLKSSGLSLSMYGEDVSVYQGSKNSPTFICAAEFGSGGFVRVPAGLKVGETAIELPYYENCVYKGAKAGA